MVESQGQAYLKGRREAIGGVGRPEDAGAWQRGMRGRVGLLLRLPAGVRQSTPPEALADMARERGISA